MTAVHLDLFLRVELEFFMLEQVVHVGDALLKPVHIAGVNLKGGAQVGSAVSAGGEFVQVGAVMVKLGEVGLQEIIMARIERIDVAVKETLGKLLVQRALQIVEVFQEEGGHIGDAGVIGAGLEPGMGNDGSRGIGMALLADAAGGDDKDQERRSREGKQRDSDLAHV